MGDRVVAGASGFIGRALCRLLADEGHRVVALSRDPGFRFPDPRVESAPLDRPPKLAGAVCFHLSGASSLEEIERNYERSLSEARGAAERLLSGGYAKLVLASSALVYGEDDDVPRTEESPLRPRSSYARLKAELEPLFSGGRHVVARISNVYGPGMSPANVFSHILSQLEAGDVVRVRSLASVRDYLHVSDAASALARLGLSDLGGTFNVSTGRGTRVDEIIAHLAKALGRGGCRAEAPVEGARKSVLVLDPRKLAKALGWTARVRVEEGFSLLLHQRR